MVILLMSAAIGIVVGGLTSLACIKTMFGYWPWHARLPDDRFQRLYRWEDARNKFVRLPR